MGCYMIEAGNLLPEIHVLCNVTQCSLGSCLEHFLPAHCRCSFIFALGPTQ